MIENLKPGSATRWGLTLLILLGGVVALYLGESIFIPTTIALLLAAMFWPVVRYLHRRIHLPWTASCLLVVLGMVVFVVLLVLSVVPLTMQLLQGLPRPDDMAGQEKLLRELPHSPGPDRAAPARQERRRRSRLSVPAQNARGPIRHRRLVQLAWYANNWLWQAVLILFLLLFLLMEGPILTRRLVEIFGPSREAQSRAVVVLSAMAHQVRTYLIWRTIINLGLALLVGMVYQGLHLRQAWTWSFLTGVGCYVPYLGPIAAGVPPVLDAFLSAGPQQALAVLLFYSIVMVFEGYVIVPVVMGRRVELNATTVMLACMFWERIWGLPGLFLAMPVMAGIKAVCATVPGWEPWANLMGTRMPDVPVRRPPKEAAAMENTRMLLPDEAAALEQTVRPPALTIRLLPSVQLFI